MENVYQELRAKRQEWLNAYNSASPEEKERMMAEKKANAKREAEEREKKIYDDRKSRFMQRADNQIKIYETLIRAKKVAMDVIKSFDGKVLNNRLTKAVETEIQKIDDGLRAYLTISYDWNEKNNVGKLEIRLFGCNTHDLDSTSVLYISLSPLNDGNRVVWAETESQKENVEHLREWIEKWKSNKKAYDKMYKQAMKLYEMIEQYGKSGNSYLINYFKEEHLISNLYYL